MDSFQSKWKQLRCKCDSSWKRHFSTQQSESKDGVRLCKRKE